MQNARRLIAGLVLAGLSVGAVAVVAAGNDNEQHDARCRWSKGWGLVCAAGNDTITLEPGNGPAVTAGPTLCSRRQWLRERLAAAAGALRVRVRDGEPGALETVLVVERGALQVLGAGRVDAHD